MSKEAFVGIVAAECVKHDISIRILQKRSVSKYGGWFDANKKELVAAYNNARGFEILLHEYNHFRQWKERNDFWRECLADDAPFIEWMENGFPEKPQEEEQRIFNAAIELERDCEINSVETVKDFGLENEVDIDVYTKEANAYLYSYLWCMKNKKFFPSKLYKKRILKAMPTEFLPLECYQKGIDKNGGSVLDLLNKEL